MSQTAPSQSTVMSVAIGAPVAVIFTWAMNTWGGVTVPGHVEAAIGAVISAAVGYLFTGGRRVDTE